MPAPTTRYRTIPNATLASALNTAAKRKAAVTGQAVVSTGSGNEADFGTVDIAAGAADSSILTMLWGVVDDGGNTLIDTFKLWLSQNDFDVGGTVIKLRALSGADQATPIMTQNYVVNATTATYTFASLPVAEPGSANLFPTSEGASMALSGDVAADELLWAWYLHAASGETTGTYRGTLTNFAFRASLKYSFS